MFFIEKTVSRCLGCKLFVHFIDICMYQHVYLICTGTKNVIRKCCLSGVFPRICMLFYRAELELESALTTERPTGIVCSTCLPLHFRDCFMIGLPRTFAHLGRRRSSQCLKTYFALGVMTKLFTTVEDVMCFMSISIVLILYFTFSCFKKNSILFFTLFISFPSGVYFR